MLLGHIILLVNVALQSREDIALVHEVCAALPFDVDQRLVCDAMLVRRSFAVFWGYRKVLEFFPKNDDSLFCEERVLRGGRAPFGGAVQVLLGGIQPR